MPVTVTREGRGKIITRLARIAAVLDTHEAAIGWFKENRYPEDEGGEYVAEVAAKHEFGFGVPVRATMAPGLKISRKLVKNALNDALYKILKNNSDPLNVLKTGAEIIKTQVYKQIVELHSPPLHYLTIKKRLERYATKPTRSSVFGIAKPLVDTGRMLATLTYTVDKIKK